MAKAKKNESGTPVSLRQLAEAYVKGDTARAKALATEALEKRASFTDEEDPQLLEVADTLRAAGLPVSPTATSIAVSVLAKTSASVLGSAYLAYQRGDAVQARSLAKAVLAGKVAKDDLSLATALSYDLSSPEAAVSAEVNAVANELVGRTVTAPKPYVMVAAIAFTFIVLVVIAATRYAHS